MKAAIIDLGTNTFNLLITEFTGSTAKSLFSTKTSVKLGEGGINKKIILEPAFERGLNALVLFNQIIKQYGVKKIYAFATSAIRNASNGKEFCKLIKDKTGIEINIIDGDREAELIYKGVKSAVKLTGEKVLIMDIGGGSTEFIIANNNEIFWKESFEIGAARLLDLFPSSEPISEDEINDIENYLSKKLISLFENVKEHEPNCLLGTSGSFDTFAEMITVRFYDREILSNVTHYDFKLSDFDTIYETIISSTKDERMKMDGLIEMRVDMIVIAAICTRFILRELGLKGMKLSAYALKEGVLSELKGELH